MIREGQDGGICTATGEVKFLDRVARQTTAKALPKNVFIKSRTKVTGSKAIRYRPSRYR